MLKIVLLCIRESARLLGNIHTHEFSQNTSFPLKSSGDKGRVDMATPPSAEVALSCRYKSKTTMNVKENGVTTVASVGYFSCTNIVLILLKYLTILPWIWQQGSARFAVEVLNIALHVRYPTPDERRGIFTSVCPMIFTEMNNNARQ